jgi:hypothetical protein
MTEHQRQRVVFVGGIKDSEKSVLQKETKLTKRDNATQFTFALFSVWLDVALGSIYDSIGS